MTLSPERQSARMSQITNDRLTRSGTGCFIAVPIWQQWASKGEAQLVGHRPVYTWQCMRVGWTTSRPRINQLTSPAVCRTGSAPRPSIHPTAERSRRPALFTLRQAISLAVQSIQPCNSTGHFRRLGLTYLRF